MNLREVEQETRQERARILKRLVESSLPVAQIDFTSTEEEGNRNKGNERAFSSDQSAIAVTEGEETEPKTAKDAECQTIEFDYMFQTSGYQAPNKDIF